MSTSAVGTRRWPILPWLPGYQMSWLGQDIPAGLITMAVVLPQAMAYATLAGLPLEYGLYCALVPMALYVVLGTSRPLSVSTTSTISLLTAVAIASAPAGSDPTVVATTLAVMAGVVLLLARLLHLGFIEDFISRPILAGFKVGMGLTIAASQIGKLLGFDISGQTFDEKIVSALQGVDQASLVTLTLSVVAVGALLVLRRFDRRIPGPLIVVAGGMFLMAVLGLDDSPIATVPPVPGGLPGLTLPELSLVRGLLPAALAIALMSFIESMAASRSFRAPGDPALDADRELVALGAANLGGGLFSAYGAGGGLSQTAVNDGAGARTQAAGLVTVATTVIVLVAFTGILRFIPEAVLGAVVLVAAIGLVDTRDLREIRRIQPADLAMGLITLVVVLIAGVVVGLFVGLVASGVVLGWYVNHAPIRVLGRKPGTDIYRAHDLHPADETIAGLLIIRPEAGLYFGNAHRIVDRITRLVDESPERPDVLLMDMSVVSVVDSTAVAVIDEFASQVEATGVEVWSAALTDTTLGVARRTSSWLEREARTAYPTVPDAVAAFGRSGASRGHASRTGTASASAPVE
ncbi:MAG: SulP family inorganic anion transporter [Chloroflexota bacterium]|nr:SulP family inorganic anion transporter [Chloroflexota bacterium]